MVRDGSGVMNQTSYRFALAAIATSGWLFSGAVHETGHAIAAKIAGLDVVHIQPWALWGRSHVRFAGETTRWWYAAIHMAGMLFAVFVGICGALGASMLAQKWRAARHALWFFIPMMCQCLAWVALPLGMMFGARASRDDLTKFMHQTGWHAFPVMLIGLALLALCATVLKRVVKTATNVSSHGFRLRSSLKISQL